MHLSFHQILPLLVYLHVHIDSNLNFAVYLCIVRFVYKGIQREQKKRKERITSSEESQMAPDGAQGSWSVASPFARLTRPGTAAAWPWQSSRAAACCCRNVSALWCPWCASTEISGVVMVLNILYCLYCLLLLYSVGMDKMGKSIVIDLLNTNSHLDGCAYWLMERRISFSPKQSGNPEMVILAKDTVYVALVKSVIKEVHCSWFTLQSLVPRSRT